jgi:hypothetical protein
MLYRSAVVALGAAERCRDVVAASANNLCRDSWSARVVDSRGNAISSDLPDRPIDAGDG